MKTTHLAIIVNLLFLSLLAPLPTWAANPCDEANNLFKQSLNQPPAQAEDSLKKATQKCPNHAPALNNLANIKEKQGNLSEALRLYKKAIKANSQFAYAYAGIGDVLIKQRDYQKAAKFFQKFLTLQGKGNNVQEYKQKLKNAQNNIVVSASEIYQNLSTKRSIGPPKVVDVPIQFPTGSSEIRGNAKRQCQEIAQAVRDVFKTDKNSKIRIEGHTDNQGKADYNRGLSAKRAKKIKEQLVKELNLPAERFEVVGWGEEKPIARCNNGDEHGCFLNRRVTLVRIDR
ncbi:lipoprotein [Beggiatoa sp. PS]|nr:lipoprotein [Beggiatoa sp. PS]